MKYWGFALALALMSGTGYAREPFHGAADFAPEDEAEQVAWKTSDFIYTDNIKRRAITSEFAPLEQYIQGVLDKVYPEFAGKMKVRVMPDIGANAMAMPNGNIYVGGGILLRMTTEAQLAALLGHEAAHAVYRHGVEGAETQLVVKGAVSLVNTAISAIPMPVTGLAGLAVNPLIKMAGQYGVGLTGMSSIFGFSRAREREADEVGFQRMVAAGYDPKEAVKLFEALALETTYSQRSEPFFFASHPALTSRIDNYNELTANTAKIGSFVGEAEFDAQVRPYRERLADREMRWLRHRSIVGYFERPDVGKLYGPGVAAFYLGEAYRRQGTQDDVLKAPLAYRRAIQEGYPADQVMEPLILSYLRIKQGKEAQGVIQEWIARGKPADSLDIKEYQAQADKLIKG